MPKYTINNKKIHWRVYMDIIFQGTHNASETSQTLSEVIKLLNTKYNITNFREINLSVTLVNGHGEDVELIDNITNQVYRYFEIRESRSDLKTKIKNNKSQIKLIIDNTKS